DNNRYLLYASHINLAQQAWEVTNIGRVMELLEYQRPRSGQEDLRGFEWYHLWRLCNRDLFTLRHEDAVLSLSFSHEGKTLATASSDKTVKLWNVTTGQETATIKGHSSWVCSVAYFPDDRTLATGSYDGTVR